MQTRLRRSAAIAAIVMGLTIAAAGITPAAAQSTIRVVVNGEPITSNDIAERARLMRLTNRTITGASIERAAMEELIDEHLKLQEAKRVDMTVSDAQVDGAFASIAGRLKIGPAQLAQGLSSQGISTKAFKDRLRTQIVWQQLVVARFNHSVNISDSQIVDALSKKQPGGTATPAPGDGTTAEYTLQQVVLVVAKGGNPDARMREAEALRGKVSSCDQLVPETKSLSETMVKKLGKRTADEMQEGPRAALAETAVGHLTKPIRTQLGIEMFAVCEKRDLKGDYQIRSQVEDELRQQEGEVFARRYINDLRRIAVIDYRK